MIRIEIHFTIVYTADTVHFLEPHALAVLNTFAAQSHLQWIMAVSIKRIVALILAQPVFECLVQNASI